jgi:hypothetical protein
MKNLSKNIFHIVNQNNCILFKMPFKYFTNRINLNFSEKDFVDKAFNFNTVEEPEEYRTIYIENLPLDWDEEEIHLRLEQIGNINKLHLIKNTLGDSLGKGKIEFLI